MTLFCSFPGSSAGYHVLTEVCDADLLANAMVHLSTQPQCANQAFNISNGDVFRWCQVQGRARGYDSTGCFFGCRKLNVRKRLLFFSAVAKVVGFRHWFWVLSASELLITNLQRL